MNREAGSLTANGVGRGLEFAREEVTSSVFQDVEMKVVLRRCMARITLKI